MSEKSLKNVSQTMTGEHELREKGKNKSVKETQRVTESEKPTEKSMGWELSGDIRVMYKCLNGVVETFDLKSKVWNMKVRVIQKMGQEGLFKVTGQGVTKPEFVVPLSEVGTLYGFKVGVMQVDPKPPLRKRRMQFDGREIFGAYNVNTIKEKDVLIEHYMRKVDLSVLAIQETKQTRSDRRWSIPGCVVYESRPIKLGPSSRGLATIVRKDVFPEVL